MLTIKKEINGGTVTFCLGGRLDDDNASQLEAELQRLPKRMNALVFDLKDLEYISTTGLRVLILAQKQMNSRGRMYLTNVGPDVMQTMEIKGLSEVFNIWD